MISIQYRVFGIQYQDKIIRNTEYGILDTQYLIHNTTPVKTLFIDIASHDAVIACIDQTIISQQSAHHRIRDDELVSLIEEVLKDAGWEYQNLDRIACVVGPGGFTSLRIAVTSANVLSDQLGIPSVGVHLSELYFARVGGGGLGGGAFWIHSTKKNEVFISGGSWKEPQHITLDELTKNLPSDSMWTGELIDEHQDAIKNQKAQLQPLDEILPSFLAHLTYEKQILKPWYGRSW